MKEATADGDVSDEEKDRIRKAQDAYSPAEELVGKYAAKLRSAQDEMQKRTGSVKPQGSFYARTAANLRGNMMDQRMFQATQEMEFDFGNVDSIPKNEVVPTRDFDVTND